MVDHGCMLGFPSIRKLSKDCKSEIRKWFRRGKLSSSSSKRKKDNLVKSQNQTLQGDKQERNAMNGIHSFRCNGDPLSSNDPMSSSGLYRHKSVDSGFPMSSTGFYRHKSVDSGFPSVESVSRNASTRAHPINQANKKMTKSGPIPSSSSLRNSSPTLSKSARLNSTPIMFSNSSGMLKPRPIEKKLECALEELCYGCKKKIKITREVLTDTGGIVQEEEMLTIEVKPGWKKGTKITFEGKGNERPGAYREDIIFIITEKRHQMFRREGDDLELAVKIPLVKALTGCTISIPLLGGEQMNLTIDDIVNPGYEKIIAGQGMPLSKEPGKRGDLKLKFLVQFPAQLTDDQRSQVVSILQDSC